MDENTATEKYPVVWVPDEATKSGSQLHEFMQLVGAKGHGVFSGYEDFRQWTVDHPETFWSSLWEYAGVICEKPWDDVLCRADQMPGAQWFAGSRLNFAQNLLRYRDAHPALIFRDEAGRELRQDYAALYAQSARLAATFKAWGLGPGDRIAAVLPNIPQAVIGMLACSWIGATWSSCSPDFGVEGIVDRFGQIAPKLLIATDGYRFKGKAIDLRDKVDAVWSALRPGCDRCLLINSLDIGRVENAHDWDAALDHQHAAPSFAQLPFDHPLYILFSSGTTGKPKCIVHGAGGTLLQHLKEHRLHLDLRREDRLFYFTTCGWMMWNWLVSGLASGASLVLFDGHPSFPDEDALWQLAEELRVTVFGTSAKYLSAQQKAGVRVVDRMPLESLRTLLSTGSPLAPASFDYVLCDIRPGVQISSISGGTDIVSCFALGCPLLPVRRGQLQCRGLGMAVTVFDPDGKVLVDAPGELVCTKPFPNMPLGFWDDPDGERYRAAYFERFAGVWTQGDWTTLTRSGGLIIDGRSDAVLNPGGVRIGTAEIYRQVERLPEIRESICVGQRWADDVRVVLFVVLRQGLILDEALCDRIRGVLRKNASPRHVPAQILEVQDIPRTRSGKISELAVRDTVEGRVVANTSALSNAEVLAQYRDRPELLAD